MSLDFMYEISVRAVTKHVYTYYLRAMHMKMSRVKCTKIVKKNHHKNRNLGKMLLFMRVRFSLNIEPANR